MKLKDKVSIVTGAASGMGKAIADLYAEEGAKVVAADIDIEGVKKVVEGIESDNGTATAVEADVTKSDDIEKMIDTAVDTYGTLDILINNAGITDNFLSAKDVTDEIWEKVFAVHVDAPMRAIREALPIFIEKESGVIVNTASVGGLQGSRSGIAYTASKHALIGITRNVGFQYAEKGIRCNAIAPGAVETNIDQTINNPDEFGMERATSGMVLNPRLGDPEEIAKVALFLGSDDSSFINGEVIVADGGWTAY